MAKVVNCVVFTGCLDLSEPTVILPAEVLPCQRLLAPAFPAPLFRVMSLYLISDIHSASNIYYVRLLEWGVAWLPFLTGSDSSIVRVHHHATSCQIHTTLLTSVALSKVQLFPSMMLQRSQLHRKVDYISRTRIKSMILLLSV